MDTDRKACNRPTCGNRNKCAQLNKDAKRSAMTFCRPGAEPAKAASPNVGNSTQILFVDSNFTETPSEYDIFYDCYSDVEINQPNAVVSSMCGLSVPPPPVKDSRMFRDALKQVILTAQTLLVEFDSGGRKERRRCGSRCRCDVRNIKPQTQTVQLEVTAKVASNKSSTPQNIRIDPITFTIPLKLHVQGQHQHNIPYSVSQQSDELRKQPAMLDRDAISNMFSSMEPIRTAIITAPRQEMSYMPTEGSGPAFNFQSALLQQMVGIPPGFLQLPLPGADEFTAPVPPKGVSSRVQIQVPPPPPLMTLGGADETATVKSKGSCGGTCGVKPQKGPSTEAFLSPSLAPVTRGPFLATITTSSVPSVGAGKSPQVSETRSQGVCVLCGRGGEQLDKRMESSKRAPCGMCSKGKFAMPQSREFPSPMPKTRTYGEHSRCDRTTEPLVVLVPPAIPRSAVGPDVKASSNTCPFGGLQKQMEIQRPHGAACSIGPSVLRPEQPSDVKRAFKGPCGMCSVEVPAPPPFEEPIAKGPCGVCSKPKLSTQTVKAEKVACTTPSEHFNSKGICLNREEAIVKEEKVPCGICSIKSKDTIDFAKAPCGIGSKTAVEPLHVEKAPCEICSKKSTTPMEVVKGPCGVCSKSVEEPVKMEKPPCGICSKSVGEPVKGEIIPCGICSKKSTATMDTVKVPCGVCSKSVDEPVKMKAPMEVVKPSCGICSKSGEETVKISKAPCGICTKKSVTPMEVVKGPCGVCSKSVEQPLKSQKAPCGICSKKSAMEVVKGPCGVCSKSVEEPVKPCGICSKGIVTPSPVETGPCGVCSRGGAPIEIEEKGPCGICSRGGASIEIEEKGPCGVCSRGIESAPTDYHVSSQVQEIKGPCGLCTKVQGSSKMNTEGLGGPCNICKKGPPISPDSRDICGICKKVRAPESPAMRSGQEPCGKCMPFGAPCKICAQAPTTSSAGGSCGTCKFTASSPSSRNKTCGSCLVGSPKPSNIRSCGTCLFPPPAVKDRTCGTCMVMPTPEISELISPITVESVKEPRIFKALPQHKDIHICSPCRYDPSPLIDEEGNVFCPHNCGCCLCPWRKRATDSQIDQIKHEKIKVCKCRMKGSIFADYTSRAKCSNTSYFDCCPCRERAEAKYLEITGEEMWSPDDKLRERVRGDPVKLEDVVEYKRTSTP